jgi:ribosomal protein L21
MLGQEAQPKVVAYKYKRRKSSKKKIGHRQDMVKLKVKSIEIGG